jgi:RNA polymerase sigma-70 factor, ECF subfamily
LTLLSRCLGQGHAHCARRRTLLIWRGASISELVDLLSRTAAKDRQAFAQLYHATNAKLFGIVIRILPQRALAEDVLQEVYLRIWEHAGAFDPTRASPISWMAAIARNRALDDLRRKKPLMLEDFPGTPELSAAAEHPMDKQEKSEELQKLLECLNGLEPDKRQMILLAYYRGHSREALAERFKAPSATIKTWLRRSLAQLKSCLET